MIASPEVIAQSRQLVRLRALRMDVAARALARSRVALAACEDALTTAQTALRQADAAQANARANLARAADLLALRLAHLRGCTATCAEAAAAAERATTERDTAFTATRTAARAFEIARARHDRLDAHARSQRRHRARVIEERAAETDSLARRART